MGKYIKGKRIKLYKDIQAWNSEQDKPTFGHVIDDAELVTSIVDVPYLEFNITFPKGQDPRGATRGLTIPLEILVDNRENPIYDPINGPITAVLVDGEEVIVNGGASSSCYYDGHYYVINYFYIIGEQETTHKLRLIIPSGEINGGSFATCPKEGGGSDYILPINDPTKYKSHNVEVMFYD